MRFIAAVRGVSKSAGGEGAGRKLQAALGSELEGRAEVKLLNVRMQNACRELMRIRSVGLRGAGGGEERRRRDAIGWCGTHGSR